MASASLRSTLRTAVAVGAFGALTVFGTAATAGAQTGGEVSPSGFGSLGSVSGLIGNWGNFDNFFGGSVEQGGSVEGMVGSAGASVGQLGSQQDAVQTATGSTTGSSASIGQIAGNIDPDAITETNAGSTAGSNDFVGMLTVVDGASISNLIGSGSAALGELPTA